MVISFKKILRTNIMIFMPSHKIFNVTVVK